MTPLDLATLLIRAIEEHRGEIHAQSMPFVGRVTFRVDLDCNVTMEHVQMSVQPCREPRPEGAG